MEVKKKRSCMCERSRIHKNTKYKVINKKQRWSPDPAQTPHLALGERKAEDVECLGGVLGVAGRSDCRDALLHQPAEGHPARRVLPLGLGACAGLHLGVTNMNL